MKSIFDALPIVAASYGDNMGVKVIVGGREAKTDGQCIQIPYLDMNADPQLKSVVWGYLSHEAAHVKFSSFLEKYFHGLPALGLSIQNLIEDIRIENALIAELPGTRFTMDDVADYLKRSYSPSEEDEKIPAQVLFSYLYNWLYCVFREQKFLQNDLDKSRRIFDSTFPKQFCAGLENLIRQRMPTVNSTAKANQLTKDILDLVEQHIAPEEPEKPEDPQQQQNNYGKDQGSAHAPKDGPSDGQQQVSDSDSNSNTDQKSGGVGSPEQHDPNQAESTNGGDQSEKSDQSQSQGAGSAGDAVKNNACKEALNAGVSDLDSDMGQKLKAILDANIDPNAERTALPELSYDQNLFRTGNVREINDGVLHASKLRAKLTGLVQSQQLRRNYETASGQVINTRRLDRVCSGDMRIFSHESRRREVNSDVCLLLDSSSSMSRGQRHVICNSATASLALALGDIRGVDVCAATCPGAESCVGPINYMGNPVRKNLGRFQINPHGGTPLVQALLWAVKELKAGKRERKVVLVLSDGEPFEREAVTRIITSMETSGIHLVGIGIQTDAMSHYFKQHLTINNLNDLGPKLFDIARKVI